MTTLPNELWLHIFDQLDCLPTLWTCRSVSKQTRYMALSSLYRQIMTRRDIQLDLRLGSAHSSRESESYLVRPFTLSKPLNTGFPLGRGLPLIQFKPSLNDPQRGSKGLSKCIAECCARLFAFRGRLQPEAVSDSPASETPETIEESSTQERGDKLSQADIAPVLNHLKKSCEAIATEMPRGHMSAYETIFRSVPLLVYDTI
jgi:hypothetical protein